MEIAIFGHYKHVNIVKFKKNRVTEWVLGTPKMFPVNISPPGGLERCVRVQNRG